MALQEITDYMDKIDPQNPILGIVVADTNREPIAERSVFEHDEEGLFAPAARDGFFKLTPRNAQLVAILFGASSKRRILP